MTATQVTFESLQDALLCGTVPVVFQQGVATPAPIANKIVHIYGLVPDGSNWVVTFVTEQGSIGDLTITGDVLSAVFSETTR